MDPPSSDTAQDPSVSPPPPPRDLPAKKKQFAWVPQPPPPRPKKTQQRKKKEKPPPEKSGYEMTPEELTAWVQEDMRKQLKAKKPPSKETVDPAAKKFFLSMMCQPKQKLM